MLSPCLNNSFVRMFIFSCFRARNMLWESSFWSKTRYRYLVSWLAEQYALPLIKSKMNAQNVLIIYVSVCDCKVMKINQYYKGLF